MKTPLSSEETQILSEIVQLAEGLRRNQGIAARNEQQIRTAAALQAKGYVVMTSAKFMVVAFKVTPRPRAPRARPSAAQCAICH